jgi:hypothetical protein
VTGYLTYDANVARLDDLRHRAQRRRSTRRPAVQAAVTRVAESVTIRRATDADRAALERLAALDSTRPLAGDVLLAEVGDAVVGAIELGGGDAVIADPFRPTAELVELLRVRAAGLRPATAPRRARLRSRVAYRAA